MTGGVRSGLAETLRNPVFWGILFFACAQPLLGDTCSYTYQCRGSQCAEAMGGWSGTKSQSGITYEQCESARRSVIPTGSSSCTCSADGSGGSGNPNGSTPMAQGHNLQQNLVSYGANMMVANIQNSTTRAFMNGFTNTFLQTLFDNQQQAEQQQRILAQQLAERRRWEEEQRRVAEQQRLDAMYARLSQELKLEGLPFGLTLKAMNSSTDLQLKGMNSSGPDSLQLKIGQSDSTASSYGIEGLPGVYVGGPAGSETMNGSANPAESASSGNPNLVSGPGTGTTGPGIPGLPGIYLDRVQPEQAAQVAEAGTHLTGPDQQLAQDVALKAAEKNPTLTGPSEDPKVQQYQQAAQQYQQAETNATNAQIGWNDTQNQADADKSVLALAQNKIQGGNATAELQQQYRQMVEQASTDEAAAEKAREIFDGANAQLSVTRTNAATALAALAPITAAPANSTPSRATMQVATSNSSTVDLSHARSSAPISLKLGTSNGAPIPTTQIKAAAPAGVSPAPVAMQDLGSCLSTAAGHPVADANLPTVEQLHTQLEDAQERIRRMVESQEKQDELGSEAAEQIRDAQNDAKKQAIELSADYVLHKAIAGVRSGVWESGKELGDLQNLAKAETDPSKLAALQSQIQQATTRQENLKLAKDVLEKGEKRLEEHGRLRDFNEWIAKPEEIEKTTGQMEGIKQIVQAALSESSVKAALHYTPYVDDAVKWGSSLIDTSYDLLAEYLGSAQLDQYNKNSADYLKALAALDHRVKVSVAQLSCYGSGPARPTTVPQRMIVTQSR